MTRARDEVNLSVPQRFFVTQQARRGDRHLYAQRSRFIPRSMVPLFEDILWPPVAPAYIEGLSPAPARMDWLRPSCAGSAF
jgi:DNA helicase-2/ATP-dependent DNA helicase PcrA